MGISGTDHTCTASESYSQRGHQEKDTASDLRTKFYLSYCTLWYGSYVFITNRTYEQAARYQHKLDDNAGCIQDNLHSERHLAAGWASIMYTAALSNASKELEEAARMDGANIFQQMWYVELPAIKNIIVIQFILQAGNIMSIGFEKAYALQTDMNLPASEILSTYVYRIGLLNGDYGYSTAVGLFNSVINVILLIIVNAVVKKLNDGEGI
jgi:hypothetical protein